MGIQTANQQAALAMRSTERKRSKDDLSGITHGVSNNDTIDGANVGW
jgi:hypothetical protein